MVPYWSGVYATGTCHLKFVENLSASGYLECSVEMIGIKLNKPGLSVLATGNVPVTVLHLVYFLAYLLLSTRLCMMRLSKVLCIPAQQAFNVTMNV
jgi:hypothetical protein